MDTNNTDFITGPLFLTEEVRTAIRENKDCETTGSNNFYSKLLFVMENNGIQKSSPRLREIDICDRTKNNRI